MPPCIGASVSPCGFNSGDMHNLMADSGLEVTHFRLNLSMTSKTALPTLGVIPDSRDAVR
jgi:hypothetical protein